MAADIWAFVFIFRVRVLSSQIWVLIGFEVRVLVILANPGLTSSMGQEPVARDQPHHPLSIQWFTLNPNQPDLFSIR